MWVKSGRKTWITFYMAHNKDIDEILDEDLSDQLREKGVLLFKSNLQVAQPETAVWLLGANPGLADLKAMTRELQNHPRFVNLPVNIRKNTLKKKNGEQWKNSGTQVVVVETSKDPEILKEVTKQCISVWNKKTILDFDQKEPTL